MKIGLFGGTFDPIHVGHLISAENVRELYGLDKIIFIPSAQPPHKRLSLVTPAKWRLKMVQLAIQNNPFFECSSIEIDKPGVSYTIETIQEYRKHYSKKELFFIVGSDSLFEMHSWYRIEDLVQLCEFIFVHRPGYALWEDQLKRLKLPSKVLKVLMKHPVQLDPVGVSSSEIRKRIAEERSIRYLLPAKVQKMIFEKKIYQGGSLSKRKN
jgi:nicotinate-nucleotide adenylyltransferase